MDGLEEILAGVGLEPTGAMLPTRESTTWLVRHSSGLAALRRLDPDRYPPLEARTRADLAWLHEFLAHLSCSGFPAPRPLAAFSGGSWTHRAGALWELVSYLPGEAIGWNSKPSLTDVGALLARYHQASATVPVSSQRPYAFPVGDLGQVHVDGELRGWLDELDEDLRRIGHSKAPKLVIHGDFTTHNVLAGGEPPRPTGVIDFALGYIEAPLADLGFGLWRSGRPHQEAIELDQTRVAAFVAGYTHAQPTPTQTADAITVYIRARGLQQLIKRHRRNKPTAPPLLRARIRWLATNHAFLQDVIARAMD